VVVGVVVIGLRAAAGLVPSAVLAPAPWAEEEVVVLVVASVAVLEEEAASAAADQVDHGKCSHTMDELKFRVNNFFLTMPRAAWLAIQRSSYSVVLLCFLLVPAAAQEIPELWGMHVHDEAKILSAETLDHLEKRLIAYEDSTSNQIAILTILTLNDTPLEEYSLKVAEHWKLGDEGKDNGVLLLIVVDDHKMRIETGYGLEGVLTDAVSSRIIRNEIAPEFRQNDFDAGITAGTRAIMRAIGGEYSADEGKNGIEELGLIPRLLIGLFVFGVLGVFTFLAIILPGCAGWVLYAFLIPFYGTFPMIVLGTDGALAVAGAYVVGLPIAKLLLAKSGWGKRMRKRMGTTGSGSGWSSASGWSGGGSSGRSSGGFSGGGGSFGGGGSSGSW
jgi:uncharacterized protein